MHSCSCLEVYVHKQYPEPEVWLRTKCFKSKKNKLTVSSHKIQWWSVGTCYVKPLIQAVWDQGVYVIKSVRNLEISILRSMYIVIYIRGGMNGDFPTSNL